MYTNLSAIRSQQPNMCNARKCLINFDIEHYSILTYTMFNQACLQLVPSSHTLRHVKAEKQITPVESVHAPRLFAANLEIKSCEISKTANDTVTTTYRTMFSPRTPSQRTGSSPFNMTPRANKSMQNRRVSSIFTPQSQKKGRYDIFIQHNVVCKH